MFAGIGESTTSREMNPGYSESKSNPLARVFAGSWDILMNVPFVERTSFQTEVSHPA